MIKKVDSTLIYKYNLLATDEYAYKHIVEIILNTIKELQILDKNPHAAISNKIIPNFFIKDLNQEPSDVLKLLFQNPYFPDEKKIELLKTIKDNYELFKSRFDLKNNKEVFEKIFDFTNSIFLNEPKLKREIEKIFPFYKSDNEYNDMFLDKDNKTDQLFFQHIDQVRKLVLFKEYSKEKQLPEIDEKIRINISALNKMIKVNSKYQLNPNFFKFLSKNWFKDVDEFKKDSIKSDVLEISSNIKLKDDKKDILGHLFTHIKIDKMEQINFTLEPYDYLNSINTIENEKYRKKVYKKLQISFSFLLNEFKLFEKEFHKTNGNIGRFLYYYKTNLLSSEYDLLETLTKYQPEILENHNLKEFKELDFIFKRKDFDLEHFRNQFSSIKNDYLNAEKYNNVTSSEKNEKALKLSKFTSFSYENIYLMDYLYKNDRNLFNDVVNTYISNFKIPLLPSMMTSEKHFVYTNFNVNHFLQMDQQFKEVYLENLKDIMENVKNNYFYGYDNFLTIFQKEPHLGTIFVEETVSSNIKNSDSYEIYFNDITEYLDVLYYYKKDISIDNSNIEIDKNIIKIDNIFIFPNLQI